MKNWALSIAATLCLLSVSSVAYTGAASAEPPAAEAVATPNYTLGAGDKVRIIVYGEDTLTGEFSIASDGDLSFPLIGVLKAGGQTVSQLQVQLTNKLAAGYLRDPRVSIEVLTYRPYYILGEVNKPGEYPYTAGLTVLNAAATASGFTYRANMKNVFIKHANESAEHRYKLTTGTLVAPGDTIRITERFF
ncbi:polysaccharide biosynthesis/export family protein [Caulobacter sp. S45]|uniref:polysaccharide biosynthesis/export family protein n=1 Tax=Caulobacter sp. S45 TaxID=1641861 RepID=UPI00131BE478|nr:polysaccharide biosynthesis/export family protein [Caulobacter sp. S45]